MNPATYRLNTTSGVFNVLLVADNLVSLSHTNLYKYSISIRKEFSDNYSFVCGNSKKGKTKNWFCTNEHLIREDRTLPVLKKFLSRHNSIIWNINKFPINDMGFVVIAISPEYGGGKTTTYRLINRHGYYVDINDRRSCLTLKILRIKFLNHFDEIGKIEYEK